MKTVDNVARKASFAAHVVAGAFVHLAMTYIQALTLFMVRVTASLQRLNNSYVDHFLKLKAERERDHEA